MENGLNKKKFAEQSGIPYPTVIGWTNLNRLPDYAALNKIADFFHCSVDYLMGREGVDFTPQNVRFSLMEKRLLTQYRRLSEENKEIIFRLVEQLSEQ